MLWLLQLVRLADVSLSTCSGSMRRHVRCSKYPSTSGRPAGCAPASATVVGVNSHSQGFVASRAMKSRRSRSSASTARVSSERLQSRSVEVGWDESRATEKAWYATASKSPCWLLAMHAQCRQKSAHNDLRIRVAGFEKFH